MRTCKQVRQLQNIGVTIQCEGKFRIYHGALARVILRESGGGPQGPAPTLSPADARRLVKEGECEKVLRRQHELESRDTDGCGGIVFR